MRTLAFVIYVLFWYVMPLSLLAALYLGIAQVISSSPDALSAGEPVARRIAVYVVKVIVAIATGLLLLSFGAQVVAAPILVPLHVLCVRTGTKAGAVTWTIAAVLMTLIAASMYPLLFPGAWGVLICIAAFSLGVGIPVRALTQRLSRSTLSLSAPTEPRTTH